MVVVVSLSLIFGGYLVFEERERRIANPQGERWLARLASSAKRNVGWFIGGLIAMGIRLATKESADRAFAEAVIAFVLGTFFVLHDAMRQLPRGGKPSRS